MYFRVLVEAKNIHGDDEARKIYNKRGLEATEDFKISQMDI